MFRDTSSFRHPPFPTENDIALKMWVPHMACNAPRDDRHRDCMVSPKENIAMVRNPVAPYSEPSSYVAEFMMDAVILAMQSALWLPCRQKKQSGPSAA